MTIARSPLRSTMRSRERPRYGAQGRLVMAMRNIAALFEKVFPCATIRRMRVYPPRQSAVTPAQPLPVPLM